MHIPSGENNVKSKPSDKYKVSPGAFSFVKTYTKTIFLYWIVEGEEMILNS